MKNFSNSFRSEGFDIFEHQFLVNDGHFITIEINEAPFEHIILGFLNPQQECVHMLSFKTRQLKIKLREHMCAGQWTVVIMRTYPIDKSRVQQYSITISQDSLNNFNNYPEHFDLRSAKTDIHHSTLEGSRYYQGDLHLHTNLTDGRMSIQDLSDITRLKGMEYFAPTDHNLWVYVPTTTPVIPATEYTPDDSGHFNIYGINEHLPLVSIYKQSQNLTEALNLLLKYVKDNNLVISISHPFCQICCPTSRNFFLGDVHLLEVINHPTGDLDAVKNNYAIEAFDEIWSQGYKVFAIGGSDSHRAVVGISVNPGNPTTHLYAENNAPINLIQAMKKGSSYMTVNDTECEVHIYHGDQEILPGTEASGDISWHVKTNHSLVWNVIKNGTCIQSIEGDDCQIAAQINKGEYIRIEARDHKNHIRVFINPIHCQLVSKKDLYWYDILDRVGNNPRAI